MLLASAVAIGAASISACTVEHATYRQRQSPVRIRFQHVDAGVGWPSRLAAQMAFDGARSSQWWLVWRGGSAGGQYLASTRDIKAADWRPPSSDEAAQRPLGDISLIVTDANYTVLQEPLALGSRAPAHLLIPDLREALWYRSAPEVRIANSGQFFDLVNCSEPQVAVKE